MVSKYIKAGNAVYNAVKPLATNLGAKSVTKMKELASKAKLEAAKFDLKQTKVKLAKTFEKSDKVLNKLKTTVRRNR
tara:strand:- start:223 stop:453 length:231 start_codon:yes stop_codon:yes gene_type:complete